MLSGGGWPHPGDAPPFAVFERWDRVRSHKPQHKPQEVLRLRIAAPRTPRDAVHTQLDPLSGIWATRLVNWNDPYMDIKLRAASNEDFAFARNVYFETMRWIIGRLFGGIRPARRRTLLSFSSSMKSGSLLLTHMMLVGFRSKLTVQR